MAILWEIAVGLIFGFSLRYNEQNFISMSLSNSYYPYSATTTSNSLFQVNSTMFPFPMVVVAVAFILLIVGYALIASYVSKTAITGIAFTLLIFALTVQNFMIFRSFWNKISLNNPEGSSNFSSILYQKLNYINYNNDLQNTALTYQIGSVSLLDAVGAAIAMYCGYSAVIGRIGLG